MIDGIDAVFDQLDRWRDLPNYQLERRADIFFALYLAGFLQDRLGVPLRPQLIPEFPVHKGVVGLTDSGEKSCKIDYVAVAEDLSVVVLVELKTDSASRRCEQDNYLWRAQQAGMNALLGGLVRIFQKTQAKRKYYHLFKALEDVGLVRLPRNMHERFASGRLHGVADDILSIKIPELRCQPKIMYVQPIARRDCELGFADLAKWIERFDDPLSTRFRRSLLAWSAAPAGQCARESAQAPSARLHPRKSGGAPGG